MGSLANGRMDLDDLGNIPPGLAAMQVLCSVNQRIAILELCVKHQTCFYKDLFLRCALCT